MAYTSDQIAKLEKAIATGVLTVEHNGTRTTYRSLAEMERLLDRMKQDVSGKRRRRTVASFSRGT